MADDIGANLDQLLAQAGQRPRLGRLGHATLELGAKGYIRVDANEISYAKNGVRYRHRTPRPAML